MILYSKLFDNKKSNCCDSGTSQKAVQPKLFFSFRNKRMFGLLLGTLQKFKTEAKETEDRVNIQNMLAAVFNINK